MKNPRRVWVIEDDPGSQFVYDEILGLRYHLRVFSDISSFKAAIRNQEELPELVIADLRLPDDTFLNFLFAPEAQLFSQVPFMVVSSVDDLDALRTCFDRGAIDYITKPFGKGELVVKVERIFEKLLQKVPTLVLQDDIVIDSSSLKVSRGQMSSSLLTAKEFQILAIIQHAPERTVSRDEIITKVWGDTSVGSKTLDVHLFNLRKKMAPLDLDILYCPPNLYRLSSNRVDK